MKWMDPTGQRNPVPAAEHLYFAPLGLGALPPYPHVAVTLFASRYRSVYNVCPDRPKLLNLDHFMEFANLIHLLSLNEEDQWIFRRFAPAYQWLLGIDLSGHDICDSNFAPYSANLKEELARLLKREAAFYSRTCIEELPGEHVSHRLFIPASANGRTITHCVFFSVNERVVGLQQSTPGGSAP